MKENTRLKLRYQMLIFVVEMNRKLIGRRPKASLQHLF